MKIDSIITMKIIRVLPLILIGLLLLTGVAAAETSLLAVNVIDENGNNIDDACIVISGGSLSEPLQPIYTKNGYQSVQLTSGFTYDITVTKDGYIKYQGTVKPDDTVKVIKLTSTKKNVRFYVYDDSGTPLKGISVSANDGDGEYKGETNDEGCAIIGLVQGNTYSMTVGNDYYTYEKNKITISETEESPTYTYVLSRATVSPVITVYNDKKDVIANANIYLNGKSIGTTNEYGKCRLPTSDTGSYPISVLANGYIAYSSTEDFKQDTNDITVELANASASVTITVKDANGNPLEKASIYSDGNLIGETDSKGTYTFPGDVGKSIKLTATRDGYTTNVEKTYTVVNGENYAEITLEVGTSYININVKDSEGTAIPLATIYVDDAAVGQTDAQGYFKYTSITGKTHVISAFLEGYKGESTTITVQAGENSLNLTLKKEINVIWIVIAGAAALLIILVIILILTGRKRGGFKKKKNNGSGRYTTPPPRRDSL